MKVMMIQERSPEALLTVYGPQGDVLYTVCGQYMGLHGVFGLMDQNGREKASIRRFGSDCLGYYRVSLAGGREFSLMKRFIGHRPALQLQGLLWHVRGDTVTRSFDVADQSGQVLMTHGFTVHNGRTAYGITLPDEEEKALCCLCIAVIIDLSTGRMAPASLAGGQL